MKAKKSLALLFFVDLAFLLYGVHTLSISYKEAVIFFDTDGFLHYLVKASTALFGQNDLALRLPFIVAHLASLVLIYQVSQFFLKREEDRILAVLLFILLPGVVSSALLVNSASIVIFFTLLFLYLFLRKKEYSYMFILVVSLFIDHSCVVLYLALVAYGVYAKNRHLMLLSSLLFLVALYLYGFAITGKPRGYFLDLLGAYSLVFSPLLFLYFFYTMYRILVREKKSILWFISFIALVVSLLLSFRQRIMIEEFAPFVVVAIPLMVQVFVKSYRTRLPELRRVHRVLFIVTLTFLILNFYGTYFNQFFYRFYDNPTKHFAYKYHIAHDVAKQLKKQGIEGVKCNDIKLQKRLMFYNISATHSPKLQKEQYYHDSADVTISYMSTPIVSYNVSK